MKPHHVVKGTKVFGVNYKLYKNKIKQIKYTNITLVLIKNSNTFVFILRVCHVLCPLFEPRLSFETRQLDRLF